MATRRIAVVEIGASHVACGRFAVADGGLKLEAYATQPVDSASTDDADWQRALATALGQLPEGGGAGDCVVIAPAHLVFTRHLPAAVARFEPAEHVPLAVHETVWDQQRRPDGDRLLVAARRVALEALHAAVARAGFEVLQIVPAQLALLDAVCHERAGETNAALLVSIGARSVTLVFGSIEKVRVRTTGLGGNVVTRAIAAELATDFIRAEALKLDVSRGTCELPAESALRAAVRNATAGYGLRLSAEIRQTLAHWQREIDVSAVTQVGLIGGGADLPDLPAVLERELGMRVGRAELLPPPGIAAASTKGASAEIIGVARSVLLGPSRLVSLLPPAAKRALAARRREPLQLAAAASVVVVLFLVLWHVRRQASATSARLGPLRDEISALEVRQAKHASLLRQIQELRKRNERLRPAELARSSWLEFFDDLQARLTAMENVWLDRLQIVPSSEASEAGGQKRLRLSGRMLEASRGNPLMLERANTLLASLGTSRFVAAIGGERFEPMPEGVLGFEVTLLLNPEEPL